MLIDARGLSHPDHIKKFKEELEGLCTVYEDVDVLLDSDSDIKKFEMYIRSCRCDYTKENENGHLRIKITAPFSMCG